MDGFAVLKLIHHLRDHDFPNQSVGQVSGELLSHHGIQPGQNLPELLEQFRTMDLNEISGNN
jgi:hypothetical protein